MLFCGIVIFMIGFINLCSALVQLFNTVGIEMQKEPILLIQINARAAVYRAFQRRP